MIFTVSYHGNEIRDRNLKFSGLKSFGTKHCRAICQCVIDSIRFFPQIIFFSNSVDVERKMCTVLFLAQ